MAALVLVLVVLLVSVGIAAAKSKVQGAAAAGLVTSLKGTTSLPASDVQVIFSNILTGHRAQRSGEFDGQSFYRFSNGEVQFRLTSRPAGGTEVSAEVRGLRGSLGTRSAGWKRPSLALAALGAALITSDPDARLVQE